MSQLRARRSRYVLTSRARNTSEAGEGGAGGGTCCWKSRGPGRGYGEAAELRPRTPALQNLPGKGLRKGRVWCPWDSNFSHYRLFQLLGESSSPLVKNMVWPKPLCGLCSPEASIIRNRGSQFVRPGVRKVCALCASWIKVTSVNWLTPLSLFAGVFSFRLPLLAFSSLGPSPCGSWFMPVPIGF